MECKFCNLPLDEGNSVCPHCGKDNAEELLTAQETAAEEVNEAVVMEVPAEEAAAEETPAEVEPAEENQPAEIKEGIRMTPGKLTAIIVGAVALVAVLVALVLWGMGVKLSFGGDESEATGAAEETVVPTIPADGNPDDVTCKGSYTVSDEEVVQLRDVVVATAGEHELTNADLQIFYWLQVQQFLGEYGYYASYIGLDYTQPLDTQLCSMSDTAITWQQYFLDAAIATWHNYQALGSESLALGYEIEEWIRTDLDNMEQILAEDAVARGFETAEEYLAYNVGNGSTIEDYIQYLELYYQGYAYFMDLYEQFDPTEEELEAYFDEHAEGYAESGITKDAGDFVGVRHILIRPEGGTTDESGVTTYSDEEWEACLTKAQEIYDEWLAGEATEDTFAQLANEKSADSDGTDGGLYTQVTQGQMVEEFDAWIFDEARVKGDSGLVKTVYGYHIMYFVSRQPQWQYYAESDYIGEKVTAEVTAVTEKYPLTVDYSKAAIGFVEMT